METQQERDNNNEQALAVRLIESLEKSGTDFRTVDSLANELGAESDMVRQELDGLYPVVRKAISLSAHYDDWYRLSSKGLTPNERRSHLRALITFQSLRNSDF